MPTDQNLLSIGALSRACGIPAETLRTWERRYGFPAPVRTQSGHRRYPFQTLDRLQLVTRALSHGHRAAVVLPAEVDTLLQLVDAERVGGSTPAAAGSEQGAAAGPGSERGAAAEAGREDEPRVIHDRLVEHVLRFEGRAFERELRRGWAVLGGMRFIAECAAPLLVTVGDRWAAGELSVANEHFCSERLRDFLVLQWRPLADAATGPEVVLATPPGERHVLGLQLAAAALALHNVRIVFLGADAPPRDIGHAVREHGCRHVVVSASSSLDEQSCKRFFEELGECLPRNVELLVGGRGVAAVAQEPGMRKLTSFRALADVFRD